jgi:hypothetical protein
LKESDFHKRILGCGQQSLPPRLYWLGLREGLQRDTRRSRMIENTLVGLLTGYGL